MGYVARFIDDFGNKHTRKYFASHVMQANRKASGIAKSHGRRLVSVGRA